MAVEAGGNGSSERNRRKRAGVYGAIWRPGRLVSATGAIVLLVSLLFAFAAAAVSGLRPLSAGQTDEIDTVVLYDRIERNSDVSFRKISEYYGLKWSKVDFPLTSLQDSHFRDGQGKIVQAAFIDAGALNGMTAASLAALKNAVATGGLKLLVAGITQSSYGVSVLTNGEVTGAEAPASRGLKYFITNQVPQVSRQFTEQTVDTQTSANDYALSIAPGAVNTAVIINGGDYVTSTYPIFVRHSQGSGEIFLQSTALNFNLEKTRLADSYYAFRPQGSVNEKFQDFSRAVPMLMFVSYAAGEEAWHASRNFANLMVDDPPLSQPFSGSYTNTFYTDLLTKMKSRNFVTTMSFVAGNYQKTQADVAQLFRDNPDYYSLIIHGDKHICPEMPASAGADQLRTVALNMLEHMAQHEKTTGIPYGREMVFPCGLYDLESLSALKRAGFMATVNSGTVPGNATKPTNFDYGMYQADLDFSNFPSVPRYDVELSIPLHELFIGRPLLVFTHPAFFQNGMDAFDSWANRFNGIAGGLEWRSLDYIMKHLYLEKLNDDQTVSVMLYTRNLFAKNSYSTERVFHFSKKETGDMPISAVQVNGVSTPFTISNGELLFDATIPAGQEVEIALLYTGDPSPSAVPRQFLPSLPKD